VSGRFSKTKDVLNFSQDKFAPIAKGIYDAMRIFENRPDVDPDFMPQLIANQQEGM